MKTIKLVLLVVLFYNNSIAQMAEFDKALKEYISLIHNPYSESDDFVIYTVEIKNYESQSNDFCFKISFILNSWDLNDFLPTQEFFKVEENQIVWLSLKENEVYLAELLGFTKVTSKDRIKAAQKLFPCITYSGYTYDPDSYIGCFQNGRLIGKYFEFGEPIPKHFPFTH